MFLEIRYSHKLYHHEISGKDILFPSADLGSSLETADTSLGTGCRISHNVTQMNYPVLALCYNVQTELSHSGREIYHGQVFPHPCVKCSGLARSAVRARCVPRCRCSLARAAVPGRGGVCPVPGRRGGSAACLACRSGQATRGREHASCLSTERAATCLPFAELLPRCLGNVRISLRNTVSCFCPPAPPNSLCKLCKLLHSLLECKFLGSFHPVASGFYCSLLMVLILG